MNWRTDYIHWIRSRDFVAKCVDGLRWRLDDRNIAVLTVLLSTNYDMESVLIKGVKVVEICQNTSVSLAYLASNLL